MYNGGQAFKFKSGLGTEREESNYDDCTQHNYYNGREHILGIITHTVVIMNTTVTQTLLHMVLSYLTWYFMTLLVIQPPVIVSILAVLLLLCCKIWNLIKFINQLSGYGS